MQVIEINLFVYKTEELQDNFLPLSPKLGIFLTKIALNGPNFHFMKNGIYIATL